MLGKHGAAIGTGALIVAVLSLAVSVHELKRPQQVVVIQQVATASATILPTAKSTPKASPLESPSKLLMPAKEATQSLTIPTSEKK